MNNITHKKDKLVGSKDGVYVIHVIYMLYIN